MLLLHKQNQKIYNILEKKHQNKIYKQYAFKISKEKTKAKALLGKMPVKTKIMLEEKTLEPVSQFRYMGCK